MCAKSEFMHSAKQEQVAEQGSTSVKSCFVQGRLSEQGRANNQYQGKICAMDAKSEFMYREIQERVAASKVGCQSKVVQCTGKTCAIYEKSEFMRAQSRTGTIGRAK